MLTAILVGPGGLIEAARAGGESVPSELRSKSLQVTVATATPDVIKAHISTSPPGVTPPSSGDDEPRFAPAVGSGSVKLSR